MFQSFDIWKVLAGVAIFLLGVRFLEESLRELSGRKFKLFLKRHISHKLKAIGGGAIVTGLLQSSSLLSLMVLSFVGAGVITMHNALAVILGANLGTTLNSWIVALAGFKLNIESFALPLAGIAGLCYSVFDRQSRKYNWSRFFLGFSFLFLGLGYMKIGIEGLVLDLDLHDFQKAPVIVYFAIGFLITTLIQSSSATMAITLSALHAGAIHLVDATAIVLGSEIGTTIKLFIASLDGIAAKKRVALGNFMFNTINVALVLIFLFPVNQLITAVIGIKEDIMALVFFQSLVNLLGILLFYPFLNFFASFLERQFRKTENETFYIYQVPPSPSSIAVLSLKKETHHFINAVLDFSWSCFGEQNPYQEEMILHKRYAEKNLQGKYEYIKFLYGEIHSYYIQVQKNCTDNEEIEQLERMISSVRNIMYAAKSIKDAIPDIEQLRNSSNDTKYRFYKQSGTYTMAFCRRSYELLAKTIPEEGDRDLIALYNDITKGYTATLEQLYKGNIAGFVSETEITTMLNYNRELFTFFKSLIFGLKDYLFDREQSKRFEELPGFIR